MSRRLTLTTISLTLVATVIVVLPQTAQAKTLVGTACKKIGALSGDGPGRTVICTKKGKKNIWQLVAPKKQPTPKPSSSPSVNNQKPTPSPSVSPSSSPSISPSPSASSSGCASPPVFTYDFIDPKYVRVVTPIGEQTGSGGVIAVRSYVHPSSEFNGKELPIYAPTKMILTAVSYYKPLGSAADYQPEYGLYFEVGCGISLKLFHIKGVVGKVAGSVPTVAADSSAGQNVKPVAVEAGEQLGWYKLGDKSVAFDFWVDDAEHTNQFIDAKHFANSNTLHSVCPYDFYTPTKKQIWLSKLGAPGSNPIPGTSCGVVSQGDVGTADGMWFISPTTETDHLVYDGFYQSQIMLTEDASGIIRIGGLNTSGSLSQMMVSPKTPTWAKPSSIKVGASHCWSTDSQSVNVKVTSDTTMSVLVGAGPCSSLADPSTGKTYYR
ncbi:MAG: hypothetical protein WDO06_05080 [Actinomycetota bacterium]